MQFIYWWSEEFALLKFDEKELQMGMGQTIDFWSYMRNVLIWYE